MGLALMAITWIAGLVGFVCLIIVLIKMFGQSVVHGIIGIITCGIWALIWGWMNRTAAGLGTVMPIWTLAILIQIVVQIALVVMVGSGAVGLPQPPATP